MSRIAGLRALVPGGEPLPHFARRFVKTRVFAIRRRAALRLRKPTHTEHALALELQGRIAALESRSAPRTESWAGFTAGLRDAARTRDPRAFLTWPLVRSTMFAARDSTWVRPRLDVLRSSPTRRAQWESALDEDRCGSPEPYAGLRSTSGTLIHHAYHLEILEQHTGVRLQDFDTIVEFGGGYGSMCRLLHRLGFNRTYVIQDLPELNEIQRYFLQSVGIMSGASITLTSEPDEIERLCLAADRPAALVATWSLSEAPIEVRNRLMDAVKDFDAFLLTYQATFDGIDNRAYFSSIVERLPDLEWQDFPCLGIPESRYLLGCRQGT